MAGIHCLRKPKRRRRVVLGVGDIAKTVKTGLMAGFLGEREKHLIEKDGED